MGQCRWQSASSFSVAPLVTVLGYETVGHRDLDAALNRAKTANKQTSDPRTGQGRMNYPVTVDASRAAWLQQARFRLRNADPVLARLIDDRPDFDPRAWLDQLPPMDLYGALLFQITGQQLSVQATRRILARIEALFDDHLPTATELLTVDPGKLREAGLSWRKVNTLRDLAERLTDGRLNPDVLSSLPDEELIAELTAIPGIGPWTAQGALIIALQREDVVLPGDLALRKAVQATYQLDHLPTQQEVLAIAEKWRPYRSLATSYLFSAAFEPEPRR